MASMQTSGLVLDVYDDVGGEVLRTMFASSDEIPNFVKQAHVVTADERSRLPDDVFALVLLNGEEKLRKFACIDEGNTALSVLYFLKNAHKLPAEARQVAAENLKVACGWYGLDVPEELEKEAGLAGMALRSAAKNPVGAALTAMKVPSVAKGTSQNIKANLAKVRAGEAMGGAAGGLAAMSGGMEHVAEVVGTSSMPLSCDTTAKAEPTKAVVKKTAHLRPVVDVTEKEAMTQTTVKKASRYALGERYPLDSYEQVKRASAYFDEYGKCFSPAERHEYCVNMVKRAQELGIPVSDEARKYGSEKYASAIELQFAIDARKALIDDADLRGLYDELVKSAALMPPEEYAVVLGELDKAAGVAAYYDRDVPDPFASTFGFDKTAEDEKKTFTDIIGNYYVTAADLERLKSNKPGLKSTFGDDFCEEFCKDPVGIYKSLPVDQKKLLIRMATENSPV
jgi:hypothetical protein